MQHDARQINVYFPPYKSENKRLNICNSNQKMSKKKSKFAWKLKNDICQRKP